MTGAVEFISSAAKSAASAVSSGGVSGALATVGSVASIAAAASSIFAKPEKQQAPVLPPPPAALVIPDAIGAKPVDTTAEQVNIEAAAKSRALRRRQSLNTRSRNVAVDNNGNSLLGS